MEMDAMLRFESEHRKAKIRKGSHGREPFALSDYNPRSLF